MLRRFFSRNFVYSWLLRESCRVGANIAVFEIIDVSNVIFVVVAGTQ